MDRQTQTVETEMQKTIQLMDVFSTERNNKMWADLHDGWPRFADENGLTVPLYFFRVPRPVAERLLSQISVLNKGLYYVDSNERCSVFAAVYDDDGYIATLEH